MIPDPVAIAVLADAIAVRLRNETLARPRWVTADVVATHLDVDVAYVYEHSAELGARRLGDGPKARLRFRLDLVEEALCVAGRESSEPAARAFKPKRTRRRSRPLGTGVELLPIKGVERRTA